MHPTLASSPPTTHNHADGSVAPYTRIFLRPVGSPLPLGLLALMCAGVSLSCLQIGALAPTQGKTIAYLMLGFVVPLMLIATIFSFLARDTVAGTGLGLFAGAWLATSLVLMTGKPGATSPAFGVFLLALGAAMFVVIAGASFGKAGPALVILVGAGRFIIAGLYELIGSTGLEHAAAIVGFVLAGVALYSALATEVEDVSGRPRLPLGRRAKARDALEAPFDSQVELLEHEAGVRQQL